MHGDLDGPEGVNTCYHTIRTDRRCSMFQASVNTCAPQSPSARILKRGKALCGNQGIPDREKNGARLPQIVVRIPP